MTIQVGRERRVARRVRQRYKLRFWGDDFDEAAGFTSDVSASGLFVETRKLPRKGMRLHLQLDMDDGPFSCEGVVARVQKVSASVAPVLSPGFGVRLISWPEICGLAEAEPAQELHLDLRQRLQSFVDEELSSGGLFIETSTPPTMGSEVAVNIELPDPHGELLLATRVVYVSEDPAGAGLELGDAETLTRRLLAIARPEVAAARLDVAVGGKVEVRLDGENGPSVAICHVDELQPTVVAAESDEVELEVDGLIVGVTPAPAEADADEVDAAFHTLAANGEAAVPGVAILPLDVSSPEGVRRMFEADLVQGGLFVPGATGVQVNERVRVVLTLPPPHGVFEVEATVVQVLDGSVGVGVHLDSPRMLLVKCAQILEAHASESGSD